MATIITFDKPPFGRVKIDACLTQQHNRSADVAKHKVEDGAEITDHVRPGPYTLSITGIIAASPPRNPLDAAIGALFDTNRTGWPYERLMTAMEKSELCTIETSKRTYKNMAIKSVDSPVESKTGSDFVFTLQAEEVRFVSSQSSLIPADALGKLASSAAGKTAAGKAASAKTQAQAKPPQVKGAAPKAAPPAPAAARGASVASRMLGFGG